MRDRTMKKEERLACYIGVDNGVSGGVVIMLAATGRIAALRTMPTQTTRKGNEIDAKTLRKWLLEELARILHMAVDNPHMPSDRATVVIEEPGGAQSYKAAVSMAASFHSLRAMFELDGFKLIRVTPSKWQTPMLNAKKGQTKPAALNMARSLWPQEDWLPTIKCTKPHDGLIDAALIAEWARRERL